MQAMAVEKFLGAVRRRPALWDCHSEEYKDRDLKKHGWLEVCQIMCPDFADKGSAERLQIEKDMQLKWKNLRDAYVRHIRMRMDKPRKSKPMRTYIYSNQMSFLRRVINPRARSKRGVLSNTSQPFIKDEEESELTHEDLMEMVEHDEQSSGLGPSTLDDEEPEEKRVSPTVVNVDPLMAEVAENEVRDCDNDDLNFFKSLLPTLQKLRTEQKLKFRIDVMELLMTYHQASRK